MTLLYLVRHGETDWNANRKVQGHRDIELNKLGLKQAEAVAKKLACESIDAVYSSSLGRAKTTAQVIAEASKIKVHELHELKEISLGPWEGLTIDEINISYPEHFKIYRENPGNFNMPGAETFLQVADRFCKAINSIISQNNDKKIVIVSHGTAIKAAIISILGMDINYYTRFRIDNASISILNFNEKYHGGVIVNSLNDTCHIEP